MRPVTCPVCGYDKAAPDECPDCLGRAAYHAGLPMVAPYRKDSAWAAAWRVAWKREARKDGKVPPLTECEAHRAEREWPGVGEQLDLFGEGGR